MDAQKASASLLGVRHIYIETMTKNEWLQCTDASKMLAYLWKKEPYRSVADKFEPYPNSENWFDYLNVLMPLYKFYLSSCRKIWPLLTQEASRKGIELAELFMQNKVRWDAVSEYNWYVEAAAFTFEHPADMKKIEVWVTEVETKSPELITKLLKAKDQDGALNTRSLLHHAAYFADHVMMYPSITPKGLHNKEYNKFVCPELLRKYVGYP